MSTTEAVPPDNDTVKQAFKAPETETTALFEHLDFSVLINLLVFRPRIRGETRVHEPPELLKSVLHCFYNDIYGLWPMARELRNEDVWRQCGFERPQSRWTPSRFITDFALVTEDIFIKLVHGLVERNLLGKLFRIDGTDIPVYQRDDEASWNYDHSEDEYYYGHGCCVVTAETTFRSQQRLLRRRRLMRRQRYPSDIEYRVEERIKSTATPFISGNANLTKSIQNAYELKQRSACARILTSVSGVIRGWVCIKSPIPIVLCFRLAVTLTNHHQVNNVASLTITLWEQFHTTAS